MVFLFSYYLCDYIFNLLFMIAYYFTMVIFIFLPFILISYFKFIFVPFFLIYFLLRHFFLYCASNETIVCFICMSLFSVLSLLAFWKSSEKNAKTIRTAGKTQFTLSLLLYCNYRSWAGQIYTLFLSTLPYLSFNRPPYPELGHPRRQNIVTQSNKPKHLAEHNSIPHGGRTRLSDLRTSLQVHNAYIRYLIRVCDTHFF